MMTKSLTYKYL